MRILFLGSDYNPISIACADALAGSPSHEVTIGIESRMSRGRGATLVHAIRSYGVPFTARRARDYGLARIRIMTSAAAWIGGRPRSLHEVALARATPCVPVDRLSDAATMARLATLAPDLVVVAAFSQILKRPMLELPALGVVNVHPSLLPAYRGPNPFYWVLQRGERETGVTVHYLDEGVDTGDTILQEKLEIAPSEGERSLQRRSAVLGASLLLRAVDLIADGRAPRTRQEEASASYFPNPPRGASRL
jgi:methionyl-tRNA formyltransferase